MNSYKIKRVSSTDKHGTFGVFLIDDLPVCVTLEETWLDNKTSISCIPAGTYQVEAYSGTRYKNVWIVKDVPNRSAILIHWGNTENHTAGCILMGRRFETFKGIRGIAESMMTIAMLRKILPKKFTLEIQDCF
ncbi:MAG: DUF5675 family protein [Culicoidibacterales bacterium]